MEEKELQELERALQAASPAPWQALLRSAYNSLAPAMLYPATGMPPAIGTALRDQDAAAIAALRNAAPSLISDLREARRLLGWIRGMIAEDTTFPGAILRVEIDALLSGERSDRERSSPPESNAVGSKVAHDPREEDR